MLIGAIVPAVCYKLHYWVERRFKIDDAVGAVAVHGYGGFLGVVVAGFMLWGQPSSPYEGFAVITPWGNFIGAVIMFALGFVPVYIAGEDPRQLRPLARSAEGRARGPRLCDQRGFLGCRQRSQHGRTSDDQVATGQGDATMSTNGMTSWAVDLSNVGAIYPFQGAKFSSSSSVSSSGSAGTSSRRARKRKSTRRMSPPTGPVTRPGHPSTATSKPVERASGPAGPLRRVSSCPQIGLKLGQVGAGEE